MPRTKKTETGPVKTAMAPTTKATSTSTPPKAGLKRSASVLAKRSMVSPVSEKKSSTGKSTKNPKTLARAEGSYRFWLYEGPVISDLRELHAAFRKMTTKQWMHHVGKGKNDFAPWVEHVLCDVPCAKDLRTAKSAADAMRAVEKALKTYE